MTSTEILEYARSLGYTKETDQESVSYILGYHSALDGYPLYAFQSPSESFKQGHIDGKGDKDSRHKVG